MAVKVQSSKKEDRRTRKTKAQIKVALIELMAQKDKFIYGDIDKGGNITGCAAQGIPADVAAKIFADMESFASYAFNKSHAAAYAVVSYQTAYLKYYYPVAFMAALMTSVIKKAHQHMSRPNEEART